MTEKPLKRKNRFTQEFTVSFPEHIEDAVEAENWLNNDPRWTVGDVIDPRWGEIEVLPVNE